MDIAAVRSRCGRLGTRDSIDLKLDDTVRAEPPHRALMPVDATVVTPKILTRQDDALSRAYRVNLDMLALVALLTGGSWFSKRKRSRPRAGCVLSRS